MLPETEKVTVEDGDTFGWTNEGDLGPISYEVDQSFEARYRSVVNDVFPTRGSDYIFSDISLPLKFSAGVQLGLGFINLFYYSSTYHT